MEWYDIIDFPQYKISEKSEIVNQKTGKTLKGYKVAGGNYINFHIYDRTGKLRMRSQAKLLYCAVKGISPLSVNRHYRFVFTGEEKIFENIKIIEPFEACCLMHSKANQYKLPKETFYKETIEFSNAVLKNDWNKMIEIIDRHKRTIIKILNRYTIDDMRMEAIYDKLKSDLILAVESGNVLCGHPLPYLKNYIVLLWRKRQRMKYINFKKTNGSITFKNEDGLWDTI